MAQIPQQQWSGGPWQGGYGPYPPQGTPSTRTLTVTKWVTVSIVVLLTPLMVLWVMQGQHNLDSLRELSARVAGDNSGDGQGLKGGAEAIEHWEMLVVLQYAMAAAVILLGVFALLAGAGQSWARVMCAILTIVLVGAVVWGVIDSGEEGLWGLVFTVPFFVLFVLWLLPGTSRGIRAKVARRMPAAPVPPQGWR